MAVKTEREQVVTFKIEERKTDRQRQTHMHAQGETERGGRGESYSETE